MDSITLRLRALAESSPELKEAAHIYAATLALIRDADLHVAPITMTREQACAKLEAGLPLLHDLALGLDDRAAGELMIQLARALENAHISAARPIRRALQQGTLETGDLLPRVAAGDRRAVSMLGEDLQLDSGLVWTIAQNALKPAWRAWRQQLSPLAEGVGWQHGYCPICGSTTIFGELQGNEQSKHVRCLACGADWPSHRMQCMYCGNEDHNTLGYLDARPDGGHNHSRIETCDRCGGYLKVIAAFSPMPVELLTVEDLATLRLDYIARARGYVAGVAVNSGERSPLRSAGRQ